MNARERIADLLWWGVPSSSDSEAKARTEQMLDAHAAEVIAARDAQVAAEFQQVIDTAPDQRVADIWRDNATAYHAIVRSLQIQDGER